MSVALNTHSLHNASRVNLLSTQTPAKCKVYSGISCRQFGDKDFDD